jgi:hypothetical protein
MPEYLVVELLVLAIAIGLWFENRRHSPRKKDDQDGGDPPHA